MQTIIIPFKGFLNTRFRKRWSIMKFVKRTRLRISNLEEVGAHVIALDTIKRKLLLVNTTPRTSSCMIIDLDRLESCSINKEYESIHAGELKTKKLQQFLKRMFLKFVFKNGSGTIALSLFDAQMVPPGSIEQLETQAIKWQGIISKLLPVYKTPRPACLMAS